MHISGRELGGVGACCDGEDTDKWLPPASRRVDIVWDQVVDA